MKLFSLKQNINWVAIGFIFIACLMMNFILRYGLPLDTTTESQMRYITQNKHLWHLGWFTWNLAAISLFVFSSLLYYQTNKTILAKTALFLIFLGLIPDLIAEYMLSFKLLDFANAQDTAGFLATEALAILLTGLYANGLYNLGGITLTLILWKQRFLPSLIASISIISWLLGLSLSLFMFLNDISSSEWATAISMTTSLIFMTLVNVFCFSTPNNV